MLDDWFRPLTFRISFEEFQRLPRHPAYRYEYLRDHARLSGRPQSYHALLTIAASANLKSVVDCDHGQVRLRPLMDSDRPALAPLFAAALSRSIPLTTLNPQEQLDCAAATLKRTWDGDDGPLVPDACLVAVDDQNVPRGAILITLIYQGNMETFAEPEWLLAPPSDALAKRWGRPHLTWIFVDPPWKRWGIGEALLQAALAALHRYGYKELASTFMLGHEASMLWHWKMGFRLLNYVLSPRRFKEDHA